MKVINLSDCFPLSEKTGKRSPLPKQAEFMQVVLDPQGPKYTAYIGGVGSGKTLIGCITIIAMAVQYPGEYLITRQFMPQLKDTTLKTFLDVCPSDLILEYHIAEVRVVLRSSNNKTSTILFRQLEEPEKLKSLNLSGFFMDEGSENNEEGFLRLQDRLRGPGLRKGFIASNPKGHDYIYQWFVKQDHIKDIVLSGKLTPASEIKKKFYLIKAWTDENIHLPEDYIATMRATWSEDRKKRDLEGSFDSFEGMIFNEFRRDVHVVEPFAIPREWRRVVGADHGYRNPSAWVWGAVDYDGNIYVYREFYEKEWLIEEVCRGHKKQNKPGVLQLCKGEKLEYVKMDPSVRAHRGQSGKSDWDIYLENLPQDFPLQPANNDVTSGIDRVKSFLKLNQRTNKPRLYIFTTCQNLITELTQYRYKELRNSQLGKTNEKEEPVKVNDHSVDALRYMIMGQPEPTDIKVEKWERVKYNSLHGALMRDLENIKKPKEGKDPWD